MDRFEQNFKIVFQIKSDKYINIMFKPYKRKKTVVKKT